MPNATVGTSQVKLLDENPRRKRVVIQVQSTNVVAANTGITYIGAGFQPQSSPTLPLADYSLLQSDLINLPTQGQKLSAKWKRAIWAISDTAAQTLLVEEETEEEPPTAAPP